MPSWRKTVFWTALGSLGLYATSKYLQNKVEELNKEAELRQLAQQNIKKRFEQNQMDASLTVLSLLGGMDASEQSIMEVERLISLLSAQPTSPVQLNKPVKSLDTDGEPKEEQEEIIDDETSKTTPESPTSPISKQEKIKIWCKIRNMSISHALAHMYYLVYLSILTRVQMNLIGRQVYLASLNNLDSNLKMEKGEIESRGLPFEVERNFLALSWHFINEGSGRVLEEIKERVIVILANQKLTDRMSTEDMISLLNKVRTDCAVEELEFVSTALLPEEENVQAELVAALTGKTHIDHTSSSSGLIIDEQLLDLVREAKSYLKSAECQKCIAKCMDVIVEQFVAGLAVNGQEAIVSLVPRIHKSSTTVLHGQPNHYVKTMEKLAELNAFSAIIYSAFE